MTPEALEARRAYKRKWAKENRDKVKAAQERHWEKVAQRISAERATEEITAGRRPRG